MTPLALALMMLAAPAEEAGLEPTISIEATIKADSLRIRQSGKTEVKVWAHPGFEGEWKVDRNGIPSPIPVGKTYRNVTITLDARATVAEDGVAVEADTDAATGN